MLSCIDLLFIFIITDLKKRPNYQSSGHNNSASPKNASKSLTLLWGATGEQEWTPAITTGIFFGILTSSLEYLLMGYRKITNL